jgi:hypothetical protein
MLRWMRPNKRGVRAVVIQEGRRQVMHNVRPTAETIDGFLRPSLLLLRFDYLTTFSTRVI